MEQIDFTPLFFAAKKAEKALKKYPNESKLMGEITAAIHSIEKHFPEPPPGTYVVFGGKVHPGDWFYFGLLNAWTKIPDSAVGQDAGGRLLARSIVSEEIITATE